MDVGYATDLACIRKDYPLTGVLKRIGIAIVVRYSKCYIRKDYPTTGVLKPFKNRAHKNGCEVLDQEGLPDYWGIETFQKPRQFLTHNFVHQEGLPDYWGIETAGSVNNEQIDERIRKDYPTTGVLKHIFD